MPDLDDMSDDQMTRLATVAIAAVSGIASTAGGIIATAKLLADYIETGKEPG